MLSVFMLICWKIHMLTSIYPEFHYNQFHFAECCAIKLSFIWLSIVMQRVVTLTITKLIVVAPSVVMLNITIGGVHVLTTIKMSVIVSSVVAPNTR
jgi:hypothetical protein